MTPSRSRCAALSILVLALGCTITQTVAPVEQPLPREICIREDPKVREGFLLTLDTALRRRNFVTRTVAAGTPLDQCELMATYLGHWSWDLLLYMSYAQIRIYRRGALVGEALYDSERGGGRIFEKFIDAEDKIEELVGQLLPLGVTASSSEAGSP